MNRWWRGAWPVDGLNLAFFVTHLVLQVFTYGHMDHWGWWTAFDILAILTMLLIARVSGPEHPKRDAVLRVIHGCFCVPLIFTQVGLTIRALQLPDYCANMEAIDRWLFFGHNPIEALEALANPLLTEVMQWGYTAYLILPPVAGVLVLLKSTPQVIGRTLFSMLAVFYLSYIGYYCFPTSGPNIHNNLGPTRPCDIEPQALYSFTDPLDGPPGGLTEPLRVWIFEMELTKKDCFPSGHVALAVAATVFAFRIGRGWGLLLLPICILVTLSTMYLRYHYVIDVIAGITLAWICVGPLDRLHRRIEPVVFSFSSKRS